ncbi:WD40-repeat-containing domain protein [Tricladium varicosporioides]|nr:WD40-repeat-containing domain protein [Hymenoscyphus varicosporioides]
MSIKHDHTLNPVTALTFYGQTTGPLLLLAGEGSFLKIFEAETSRLLLQCQIFEEQDIHGIAISESVYQTKDELKVVIWGGKCVVLLSQVQLDTALSQGVTTLVEKTTTVSDWILDVAIRIDDDRTSCVLVTAHNTVLRAKLLKNGKPLLLEELPSPSKSILYSAHIIWDTSKRILIAAGTVFGEIIVWRCSILQDGQFSDSQVLFTFTGHEGSIFGVHISPLVAGLGSVDGRLLASCSDDRTIRIWDLSESSYNTKSQNGSILPRETGFGENENDGNSQTSNERCLATVMGHASRIWRVRVLVENSDFPEYPSINILSFGEDATTQQWALNLNLEPDSLELERGSRKPLAPKASLTHANAFAFHSGKHIWSTALSSLQKGPEAVATGGADGKISLYPTKKSKLNSYEAFGMWDLEDILKDFPSITLDEISIHEDRPIMDATKENIGQSTDGIKPPKKKKLKKVAKDTFNRYAFVSESQFLATTVFGRVLECELEGSPRWSEVPLPESGKFDLKSYAVVKGFPEVGLAFLAGANGKIYIWDAQNPIKELCSVNGKVADLFGVPCDDTSCFQLFATTLATSIFSAFLIALSSPGGSAPIHSCTYNLPDKFVVTSASTNHTFLVLGSRSGALAIYDSRIQEAPLCQWKDSLSSAGDAITAILPLKRPNSNQAVEKMHFVTTGRDGHYSIFSCTLAGTYNGASPVLQLLHQGTPPFGPMIESAWFQGEDLILYGFKSKNFIVWNETRQYEILTVECGGAHRSYDYSSPKLVEGGHFIYTKASKLYIHSQMNPSHKIIKQGGHGREIKTCAISPELEIIATGAEDTAIRIWQYEDVGTTLDHHFACQAVVQRHTAGIQHIQWFGTNYLFSSGGNEEFFVWAVEKIPGFGIGVVCEATCPDQSEERDLRIMSFDVSVAPGSAVDRSKIFISLAYSDSTIRSYIYSKSEAFSLAATGTYTSACLTQINHIHISDRTVYTLTAATDGNLTLWKSTVGEPFSAQSQELIFISTKKVHQNAIKVVDFQTIKSGKQVLVVSGGDDNALGISIYSMDDLSGPPIVYILRSAHAAAITGVVIMPSHPDSVDSMRETFNVVSSSNDQRVKEWLVTISTNEGKENETAIDIKMIGHTFTSIADVGDVAVLRRGKVGGRDNEGKKVLLVGNGMEVWNVSC